MRELILNITQSAVMVIVLTSECVAVKSKNKLVLKISHDTNAIIVTAAYISTRNSYLPELFFVNMYFTDECT